MAPEIDGDADSLAPDLPLSQILELRRDIAEFGFCSLQGFVSPDAVSYMREEADTVFSSSKFVSQCAPEQLGYKARIGSFGKEIAAFYEGSLALGLVERLFDGRFELSRDLSCITYYKSGDFLGPHLDTPAELCTVTILLYLDVKRPHVVEETTGLEIRIYGEEMCAGMAPILTIPSNVGTVVLGRGSRFWHERPPLKSGESVTALTGCYRQLSA